MNYLTLPFFKALLKKKESKIALAFNLFPMLLIAVGLFNTNFMRLSAPEGSLSFLEFFSAVLSTQYQMTLPLIVFIYIVSTIFRDEITSSVMYLYKDVSRKIILDAKLGGIQLFQILYLTITFFSSLVTYYTYLIHQSYTSGRLLPNNTDDLQYTIISILGTILVFVLCMMVASLSSIVLTNGFTMLVGIIFALVSYIAPHLDLLKYVFPNGYINVLDEFSFGDSLLILTLLFMIYSTVIYVVSLHLYNKIQY
ncbi:hypothetical protein [Streptococcus sp. sy018]|uniref:hypothetical protein n=1 Tax=Streptococcus sp. sy018 TaxID=2600147 RepID=UPI0011B607CC|nr:hypothetical protein [Streptococcus sp. sy018]TWS94578.1 hypothetical protein FRX52_03675 [Streptococcus sp. sy018]